jgi:hypothetical protein
VYRAWRYRYNPAARLAHVASAIINTKFGLDDRRISAFRNSNEVK